MIANVCREKLWRVLSEYGVAKRKAAQINQGIV